MDSERRAEKDDKREKEMATITKKAHAGHSFLQEHSIHRDIKS